ncbi:MAG: hypothetical protein C0179_04755, partial [Fervidicoccus sp.]
GEGFSSERSSGGLREVGLLKKLEDREEKGFTENHSLRELDDVGISELYTTLREVYRPGYRQNLILYLSGWGAKSGVSPIFLVKVVKKLHEETNDTDPLKERIGAIIYSYKKHGVDVDRYAEQIEEITGVKTYGLDKEIKEDRVKGYSGIQEILEAIVGEERALVILEKLEKIFRFSSPYKDSIFEIIDEEKNIYAIANLKRLIMARARRTQDGFKNKEIVFPVAPTKITRYVDPLTKSVKYSVVFEGATLKGPISIGPAELGDIAEVLKRQGLVYEPRLANGILSAVIQGAIRKGKYEEIEEIERPGFYILNDKLIVNKVRIEDVSAQELREALLLLNELADKWFSYARDQFSTTIKWGIISPFIFARKQLGREYQIPYLCLYGVRDTGKTTIAEISTIYLWGLPDSGYVFGGNEANTEARLGHILSRDTYPKVINEANTIFFRHDNINLLKNSVESLEARGKISEDRMIKELALSPIIFTLNPTPPVDFEGLQLVPKTLYLMYFSGEARLRTEAKECFNKEVRPRLRILKSIGHYTARLVLEEGVEAIKEGDWISLGRKLLERLYREAGLEPPDWIKEMHYVKSFEEVEEEERDHIRSVLINYVNNEYSRHISRIQTFVGEDLSTLSPEETDIEKRLLALIKNDLVPFIIRDKNDPDKIYITKEIINELKLELESLKSLAYLTGFTYVERKSFREGERVSTRSVIETSIKDLIAFLRPETE